MKNIEVVAAVIVRNGEVLATERGYGPWKGWWEFPGGKIEAGESPQEALVREIREELEAEIEVGELLETVEWDYPEFHLIMHCFLCSLISDDVCLKEHSQAAWLTADALDSVQWLPADEGLIQTIKKRFFDMEGKYYRHFKGGLYKLLHIAQDTESLKKVVVYQALYGECKVWVRDYDMFFSTVIADGAEVPRFAETDKPEL